MLHPAKSHYPPPAGPPFVLGISSGASVGATAVVVFGLFASLGVYALSAAAFLGALRATALVYLAVPAAQVRTGREGEALPDHVLRRCGQRSAQCQGRRGSGRLPAFHRQMGPGRTKIGPGAG
ncbi:iron chelate uptake ABC transporter family permease subunit [Nonomuraea sp. NPDC046802]|uniref:iron chelate uptake ABC transporter family permease subunit n=1 Tax=Nonomuraea sp. NPDC046802 TaxID=3154919 RepID=UPI0033D23F56